MRTAEENMADEWEWTRADSDAALLDGWDIFDSFGSENGPWQIQVLEEPNLLPELGYTEKKFEDDSAVWVHVWTQAEAGSALHVKALEFIKMHNPLEYRCINIYVTNLHHQDDE